MKCKDIFNLIVRLLGLAFLFQALEKVPLAFSWAFPGFNHVSGVGFLSALMGVGWPLLVGYWLLRGAPPVNRIAYPESAEHTPAQSS